MAWTNLTFAFGSVLTSAKMTQMDDNFDALANGDAGAPKIQTNALANSSVTTAKAVSGMVTETILGAASVSQIKLKTTTGTYGPGSGNFYGSGAVNAYSGPYTRPGGSYGFVNSIQNGGAATNNDLIIELSVGVTFPGAQGSFGDTAYAVFHVQQSSSSDTTWGPTATERYVQASPPYDMGDGEVAMFGFLLVNSAGGVVGVYFAREAPWHYNGPTKIAAQRVDAVSGRKYRNVHPLVAEFGSMKNAMDSLPMPEFRKRLRESDIESEITQAMKQADMPLLPHPFGLVRPGETVVLLDPVSPLMEELAVMQDQELLISDLLSRGKLQFDNTALARKSPPGVIAVDCRWKLTP